MKRLLLVILAMLSFAPQIYATSIAFDNTFFDANKAAEEGNYHQAIQLYEKMAAQDTANSFLAFNFSAIATKAGDAGRATYWARQYAKRFPLMREATVQLFISRKLAGVANPPGVELYGVDFSVAIDTLRYLTLVLAVGVTISRLFPFLRPILIWSFLGALSAVGIAEYSINKQQLFDPVFIPQEKERTVYAGPTVESQAIEKVLPGAELKLLSPNIRPWLQVQLTSGRRGWVQLLDGKIDGD